MLYKVGFSVKLKNVEMWKNAISYFYVQRKFTDKCNYEMRICQIHGVWLKSSYLLISISAVYTPAKTRFDSVPEHSRKVHAYLGESLSTKRTIPD